MDPLSGSASSDSLCVSRDAQPQDVLGERGRMAEAHGSSDETSVSQPKNLLDKSYPLPILCISIKEGQCLLWAEIRQERSLQERSLNVLLFARTGLPAIR